MITVSILINGEPIYTRSAWRIEGACSPDQPNTYQTDTGERIKHPYNDGAVELAHKMLNTIRNEIPMVKEKS